MSRDLLIIGAGALGGRVGRAWLAHSRSGRVLAETSSVHRHDGLSADGMRPRLRTDPAPPPHPFVLFCVPASGPADYAAEAARAAELWSGEGRLVMTSSTAVYAESAGGQCVEDAPLAESSRALRLVAAERPILAVGGTVVRLAGLYDRDRGPHQVFLRMATSPRRPDGLLNLIHYDDAASLCIAALDRGGPRAVYLGCDGAPVTRAELVALAADSALYGADARRCRFEGTSGPLGRRCDNRRTCEQLGWTPQFAAFAQWLEQAERRTSSGSG